MNNKIKLLFSASEIDALLSKINNGNVLTDTELLKLQNLDTSVFATKTDLHTHTNKSVIDGITAEKVASWNSKSTFSGDYNDLANKPTIPAAYNLPVANQNTLGGIKIGAGLSITADGILSATGGGTADSVEWESVIGRPTRLSYFTNDSGFITSVPDEYITETELDAKGYLTEHQDISGLALKSELHSHNNKAVIDTITSAMTTKWNKAIPFEDSYVDNCDNWLTNGYTKTSTSTTNHPSVCTGSDRWGVLFYISENTTNGTGMQMYFPIDGPYAGRVFTRRVVNRNAGAWNLMSNFDGNYENLTNRPTIPTAYTHPTTHPASMITGLATVATSGNYNDLTNLPTIPEQFVLPIANQTTLGGIKVGAGLSITADGILSATGGGTTDSGYPRFVNSTILAYVDEDNILERSEIQQGLINALNYAGSSQPGVNIIPPNEMDSSIKNLTLALSNISIELGKTINISGDIFMPGGAVSFNLYVSSGHTRISFFTLNKYYMVDYLSENDSYKEQSELMVFKTEVADVAFSGSYNDLTDKPTIPPAYTHPATHPASMITGLSRVATSGSYADLADTPVIPAAYVHPNSHPATMITGLADVATTGSYNDLTNKPTIPSIDGLASTTYVDNKVAGIVNSAPETLDTLKELATALGNDANFATTVSNQIGSKVDKVDGKGLSTNDLTNALKANYNTAYTHSQSAHAPSNAQKNSDITKAEIEAKLTGNITTHSHSQYLTEHQSLTGYAKTADLSTVATSGSYNDLSDKPIIPSEYNLPIASQTTLGGIKVGAGLSITAEGVLSATGGGTADSVNWENVVGKPTFATVATSGDYNDLTNRPLKVLPSNATAVDLYNLETGIYLVTNQINFVRTDSSIINNGVTGASLYLHPNKLIMCLGTGRLADFITNTYYVIEPDGSLAEAGTTNDIWGGKCAIDILNEISDEIPASTSAVKKYVDYVDSNKSLDGYAKTADLATVATTGSYNDLTNKPTIPTAYTHPDTHPASMITGLSTVATSGSYADLTNKPTIPTVTNDLTNALKSNYDTAYAHSQAAHAPSNAQKNSDITKSEIEAKLTGNITTHTHSQYLTSIPSEYITEQELTSKGYATATTHEEVKTTVNQILGGAYIE